jgi:hypothetical protein
VLGGLFASFLVIRRGTNWWARHAATLAVQLLHFAKGSGLVLEAKLDKRKKAAAALAKSLGDKGSLFESASPDALTGRTVRSGESRVPWPAGRFR